MLPITMTYFLKQAQGSRSRGLALGSLYGAGIVITFTLIGLIFALLIGEDGPRIFASNPWVNLAVAALFGWFAFSMFGLYEIALPSSVTDRLTGSGAPRKGYGGAFLLGLLFTVVTFTCTMPIATTILTITVKQSRAVGIYAMLVYSATMALPFVLMGAFPALVQRLKGGSGHWLHAVKVTMAFVELGLASYYLMKVDQVWGWNILTRPVMLAVYVGVLLLASLYLLGVFRMKGDEDGPATVGVGRACSALLLLILAVYIASGYAGRPLGEIDTILPPAPPGWQSGAGGGGGREGAPLEQHFATYDEALAEAGKTGKPIFLEFTGVT
jgi:thiol:disulfide interchange protein